MDSGHDRQKFFYLLLFAVTAGLCWILSPFFGAVFWGVILAILFQPVQRWLVLRLDKRHNLAALATLVLIILMVILPVIFVAATIVQEITVGYQQLQTAQPNYSRYLQQFIQALPTGLQNLLAKAGLTNIPGIQKKLADGAAQISQFAAAQALSIGQNTFQFVIGFGVMLYMVFFLVRDGPAIGRHVRRALPMDEEHKRLLLTKFTTVVRATVKGNIVVALVQGLLGGFIFAVLGIEGVVLWGALMAFLSLLPAIGASIVWVPVAVYFLMTGAVWKGVVLIAFCGGVIGLVDNLLRPLLVGKDTKMPDWVVLISTLGGMELFGITGFVIGPLVAALFMASWDIFVRAQGE
ncbi:AI-2E family transporter [Ralstonia mannitolilytica]|uniref:Inner membrane protein n=1 Tax=Ralstonia mannitolilytica TaxID=105219 RepID=A0AAJ5D3T2_9RALS|nr:AI-2E family transporter [Ralstonia mannitolilytica]CAG2151256.1 Putative transport protein YdiK [Ralstonia mannitolilytica]CAJ0731108.1 Putative transport protein YdiK [Ralstonia mannitolilytica]SUD86936.1 putative inner membrane protein [Ralstonia mannitolilytica]SUD92859.1 putative inner membrane protein [Ralstonia mannitolilytica]SUD96597.1 putative inner membrane protein [Ralstonia mannitolilytica]